MSISRFYPAYGKQLLDRLLVIAGLPIVLPILLLASVGVALKMGRPVFFVQERPGLQGRIFKLVKLRTMSADKEVDDAERLNALGRFLRATSIDELPTLWNVIKGDMSLVGPRPLLTQYLPRYSSEQMRRHHVKPGVTGWAQINGRNALSWPEKFRHDVWYADNLSLRLDVMILAKTLKKVVWRENIFAPGFATMPEFTE